MLYPLILEISQTNVPSVGVQSVPVKVHQLRCYPPPQTTPTKCTGTYGPNADLMVKGIHLTFIGECLHSTWGLSIMSYLSDLILATPIFCFG